MSSYFENITFTIENSSFDLKKSLEFVECQFNGIDFSQYNLSRFKFLDCEFHECNLSNSSLKGGHFRDVAFKKSKLIGLNWTEATSVVSCRFEDSILDYSVFHSMNLKNFSFNNCKMMEVEFSEAHLKRVSMNGCMLLGASFNKADLSEADLTGSTNYFIDIRHTNVKKTKFSMPEVMCLLTSLDIVIE